MCDGGFILLFYHYAAHINMINGGKLVLATKSNSVYFSHPIRSLNSIDFITSFSMRKGKFMRKGHDQTSNLNNAQYRGRKSWENAVYICHN